MKYFSLLFSALLAGCSEFAQPIDFKSPELEPFWEATRAVDRTEFGFSTIDPKSEVLIKRTSGRYDVMLFVKADTIRAIGFRKTALGYKWIHEQEVYTGPREFMTADGPSRETITITYETEPITGVPLNCTNILYIGPDAHPSLTSAMTIDDMRAKVKSWGFPNRP